MPESLHILDITVVTDVVDDHSVGNIFYEVILDGTAVDTSKVRVELFDRSGSKVGESSGTKGRISVQNPRLWWPHLMRPDPGYLHSMRVWAKSELDPSIQVRRVHVSKG